MSTLNVESISHPTSGSNVTINGIIPASTNSLGLRNLIINGAMQVWQRSTSVAGVADNTNEGYQSVDRYGFSFGSTHGGACTISKSTTVPSGEGFAQSYKVDVTTSATPTANQLTAIYTKIEAQDIANSGWDYTSTSSYITLSFWARSSKAGTYCVYIDSQDAATYEKYVKEYTLVAGTWKRVEITVPGKSTLAYNNDNGEGMLVYWTLSAGSSRNGSTADTWETGNNVATSNQVNFFDSTSNDFYLTGVQLEVGSVATPFEHRSYGDELRRCERYYQVFTNGVNDVAIGTGCFYTTSTLVCALPFRTTMRANPTIDATNGGSPSPFTFYIHGIGHNTATVTAGGGTTPYVAGIRPSSAVSGTQGSAGEFKTSNAAAHLAFSAEL